MSRERQEFSKKVKLEAYTRANGHCEVCTAKLFVGKFRYDHVLPDALGGEPTLANCRVTCDACDREKTYGQDIPFIARAKRIAAKHAGAKAPSRNPLPGGRRSKWRKKINGEVVPRHLSDTVRKAYQP